MLLLEKKYYVRIKLLFFVLNIIRKYHEILNAIRAKHDIRIKSE